MLKNPRNMLILLFILAIISCLLFLFWGVNANNFSFNVPRRAVKIAAFVITGFAIGFSTTVFQTVTHNRVLTPSIMGLDSLYMFIQTFIVFIFGSRQLAMMSDYTHFAISVGIMSAFSTLLFKLIFERGGQKLFVVILAGIVFGSLFGSLSTFMQVIIDPSEFLIVQDLMFASFNNVNRPLLGIATILIVLSAAYGYYHLKQLDVIQLGRDISVNLGVTHDKLVYGSIVMISIMTAVSTALVGPVTFLGLLTANLSRQLFKTYKHIVITTGAALISVIALVFGQFIIERVLTFSTTISVIINFAGGIYFIYLLMKEGRM